MATLNESNDVEHANSHNDHQRKINTKPALRGKEPPHIVFVFTVWGLFGLSWGLDHIPAVHKCCTGQVSIKRATRRH